MPGRLIRSLAYRMTMAVMILSLALSLLAAVGLFALQYREAVAVVERDLDHVGRVDVPSISAILWVMDVDQLQIHLDALRNIPHIARVEIKVKDQVVAASGAVSPGRTLDRTFPLSYISGSRTMNLGSLQVQASLDGISRELLAKSSDRLLFQTVQIFLVAVFMLSLFRLIVTRRLSVLENHLKGLSAGRLGAPLALPRSPVFTGADELDNVASAVNAMAGNLGESFRELETQKEHLAVTLRSIGDGVITTDTHGIVTLMSEAAENCTGWTQETAVGQPIAKVFTIVDESTRAQRENPVERVLQTGMVVDPANHTVLVRKDGSEIVIADSAAPIRERGGEIVGVVLVFRDITERRRAEQALRESEEIFERFMEHSPIYVFFKDEKMRSLRLSRNFETMLGKPMAELLGKSMDELFPSEFAKSMVADDVRTMAEGKVLAVEEEFAGRCYATTKFPIVIEGKPKYLAGYTIDITERKRAAEELRRERDRAQRYLDIVETIIIALDTAGRITAVNRKGCELFGCGEDELVGQNWFSTCLPQPLGLEVVYPVFQRLMAGESAAVEYFENPIVTRGGELRQVAWHNALLRDGQGRITGTLSSGEDVTESKRLAQEKGRQEDQLRQSQKMEAIGRLAGGVAHDFNNLTAIVLGYGEMLLGRLAVEDPARKWAEQIMEAGRRSTALTRQLLAFSRKQTLQPVVLDLNALLRNLEKMLGRAIGEDIALRLELSATPGLVTADPGQLEQVVMNLAINARDAMPLGGRLTIETAAVELDEMYAFGHESVIPGKYVLLALTDTGCGMDKATLAQLFEPFFTTKEKGKGTGLGLATAHGIVKQSGGYIRAYSEPGQGTTFKIFLPRTETQPAAPAVDVEGETPCGRGERILLVEDEAPLRGLVEKILARLGYRVRAVECGKEALRLALEFEPDLVLTDVIMPGMSGAELAQRLRKDRPLLPVLYMSGYPTDAIARHGVLDPGIHFIQKPFTERALAAKLRVALGSS